MHYFNTVYVTPHDSIFLKMQLKSTLLLLSAQVYAAAINTAQSQIQTPLTPDPLDAIKEE